MRTLNPHPYCLCIPENNNRAEIRESIVANPSRVVVTLYNGMILDGRTRYEICQSEGFPFETEEFCGDDEDAKWFVKNQILPRRDVTPAMRVEAFLRLDEIDGIKERASANKGGRGVVAEEKVSVAAEVAKAAGVSKRTAQSVIKARAASPEIADKILSGELSANAAEKLSANLHSVSDGEKPNDSRPLDGLKNPIPKALEPVFAEVPKFKEILEHISAARSLFKKVYEGPAGNRLRNDIAERDLGNAYRDVSFAMPFAVCPKDRRDHNGCDTCKGHGWISKELHKRLTEREGK